MTEVKPLYVAFLQVSQTVALFSKFAKVCTQFQGKNLSSCVWCNLHANLHQWRVRQGTYTVREKASYTLQTLCQAN